MILSDKERALLLEALAHHAMHIRERIDTCERDVPGLPPTSSGVIRSYCEDLLTTDRLYARIQAGGLS